MRRYRYVYTPNDIAVFLLKANLTMREENHVLRELWVEKIRIAKKYKLDELKFRQAVRLELASYVLKKNDFDEFDLIMRDVGLKYTSLTPAQEYDFVFRYFKVVRLELLFLEGKDCHKIKLRRLLAHFSYKKDTQALVQDMQNVMAGLSLVTCLRGYVPCKISEIGLDDMVMIRLE